MVPSVCEKLVKSGTEVCMQSGAGEGAGLPDRSFGQVTFMPDPQLLVRQADVVLSVQAPAVSVVERMKEGAILVSFIYEYREPELVRLLAQRKVTCFAMERVPRISRAQAMDALSGQASLAGYCGALLGATHLARVMPRMTTAAGLLRPAQVLVIGLGVAGLQAVATAHRLGATVECAPGDEGAGGLARCEVRRHRGRRSRRSPSAQRSRYRSAAPTCPS